MTAVHPPPPPPPPPPPASPLTSALVHVLGPSDDGGGVLGALEAKAGAELGLVLAQRTRLARLQPGDRGAARLTLLCRETGPDRDTP